MTYMNMTSFSYNIYDFPPLPSNEFSRQSTPVYIPVKPREQNSKIVSFCKTVNPLLFEKICLHVLLKRICFLFNQVVFSSLRLLFVVLF